MINAHAGNTVQPGQLWAGLNNAITLTHSNAENLAMPRQTLLDYRNSTMIYDGAEWRNRTYADLAALNLSDLSLLRARLSHAMVVLPGHFAHESGMLAPVLEHFGLPNLQFAHDLYTQTYLTLFNLFVDALTGVQVSVPPGALPPGTEMDVEPVDSAQIVVGPGNSVHAAFDISFVHNNQTVQPDGTVVVRIPFGNVNPSTNANWQVRHVAANGTQTPLPTRTMQIDGQWYWEFDANSFSTFAVFSTEPVAWHCNLPGILQFLLRWLAFGWIWMGAC
jgi:hypothetical protein